MPSSKKNTTHTKRSRAPVSPSASVKDVEECSPSRAELLAALRTLPNPVNPCLPPTMQYSNGWLAFRAAFNVIVGASEWAAATRSQEIISTATSPRWKAANESGAGKLWCDYAELSMKICPPNENSRAKKRNRGKGKKKALTSRRSPVLQTSHAPAANISLDTPSREPSSGKAPRSLSHPRHAPRAIATSRPVVAPSDPVQIVPSAPRFDFSGFVSPQSAFTNGWSPYGPSHPLFPFPTQCIDASSANYIMPVAFNLDSAPISTLCAAPVSMPTSQVAFQCPPPAQAFSRLALTDFSSGTDSAVSQLPVAGEPIPVQGGPSFQSPFVVVPSLPAGSSGAVAQAPSISSSPAPAYHPTPPLPVFYSARLQEPTLPQLSAISELELLPQETFIDNLLASASTQTTSGNTSFTALPAAEEEWDFFLPPTDWNAQALPLSPNDNLLGLFDLDLAATAKA